MVVGSFIHAVSKLLLDAYCVSGTTLGSGNMGIKNIQSLLHVGLRSNPAGHIRKWEEAKAETKSYLAIRLPDKCALLESLTA